ncbi:mycofactocin-coupled SDR family oxidoreductase [Mycobacterium intracellulare]|uniref:mycofactocin-coupled SDR family oxidoreductase n=1 Tax=Mycobacterium intracellulare TaxID=1767 RepID=UPI00080BCD9C|nr:mycofactocin-coupled SDR family oxidoreductase [Mycobacterium intracellulare]OCB22448.1 3-ketoacyl-ACP reductase [Mycobacterium intracellulare subsp. yongonense]
MGELEGKVAFITGAARGQGRSHAVRLAREGAHIIAIDTPDQVDTVPYQTATKADLAETAAQVQALDRRILAIEADVRDGDSLVKAAESGVEAFGRIDIVLANAGIFSTGRALEMDDETWQTMIDVNLTGVWKTVKAAVPHVINGQRGGSVVLTSSMATHAYHENAAHYTAAKAGLVGLCGVLAKELAPHNIRVNTVHPTTVATGMMLNEAGFRLFCPDIEDPTVEDFSKVAAGMNALPVRMLDPVDVSNAVLYLVSDAGRYVTGVNHLIDAGGCL